MAAMRVAIDCRKIADYGIGTYIRGLLRGLAAIGGEEEYVLLMPRELRDLAPAGPQFRLVEQRSGHYSAGELLLVGRAAHRAGADLLHAPHYVVPFMSMPFVVTIHDLIHLHVKQSNPFAAGYARWMLGRAVRDSRGIATVSQSVREEISARWPEAAAKTVVIPPAVDETFFRPPAGCAASLARHGLESARFFLYVGNDKPHKNLDRLVRGFTAAAPRLGGSLLVMAGTDPARFRGVDGVRGLGRIPLEDLRALYRSAIALVQPSLEEGFGLPPAEAMASGCPVIASNIASLDEVTGGAARRIDPRSIDSIAAALIALASDEKERSALMARGNERSRSMNSIRCAENMVTLYRAAVPRS